jgi:hypothetical protein
MRFKIAKGRMLTVAPGEKARWDEVRLLYDSANEMVGIQVTGDNQLRGYCFFIPDTSFGETKERGTPSDKVPPC